MKPNLSITYIGHATTLVEMDGMRIITDPFFRSWVWHLSRVRLAISPAWYESIDAILISHAHWDHLDIYSLRKFKPDTPLITPTGTLKLYHKTSLMDVREARPGDSFKFGELSITPTHAEHDGKRNLFGPELPCLGFVMQGSQSVYFTGDTALFDSMGGLIPDLDVALLPVWGWGPTLGDGHMDPSQAAEAARRLSPRIAIPIHWGTLYPVGLRRLLPHNLRQPPTKFADQVKKVAPGVQVKVLQPGDMVNLD